MNSPFLHRNRLMQSPPADKTADSFDRVLKGSRFQGILAKAKLHHAIDQILQSLLDKALQPHCTVALLEGNTLILHIDSAAWVTRMNFCSPQLIRALQGFPALKHLEKIQCKVRPT